MAAQAAAGMAARVTGRVAIVPAKDAAASVGATVAALVPLVDEVVVVDDGSGDDTALAALSAGARVVTLPENRGKGGAVAAGVAAAPGADVYLLVDADVGATASAAALLLEQVEAGRADMAIGVLPPAGSRGGFGRVRDLARRGIRRASGFEARAPLSGQRAVRGELLRSLALAPRFGLETAMTIDAVRAGARVVEVDVAMEHRHTGRSVAGFRHRARQGADVVRALWPRLTRSGQRIGVMAAAALVFLAASFVVAGRAVPTSAPPAAGADKVVLVGIPGLSWSDVGTGRMPNLDRLLGQGAVAAMSVRTAGKQPSTVEGYATLGAGARVKADENTAQAYDPDESVAGEDMPASEVFVNRTGTPASSAVVVLGAPATRRLNQGLHLPSLPGALGDGLHAAGRSAAVVGNADATLDRRSRPAPAALMDGTGRVDGGSVQGGFVTFDRAGAFARAADVKAVEAAVDHNLSADVVLVDPGDMDRVQAWAPLASPGAVAKARLHALQNADAVLGHVVSAAPKDALVLVVSVRPPGSEWRTTPLVAWGAGVRHGYVMSPSVRRLGVVTLTDVAPTVLASVGAPVPDGMIGHAFRYHPVAGSVDLSKLRRLDRDAAFRERIYYPLTLTYIIFQALVYLMTMLAIGRFGRVGRAAAPLKWIVVGVAAWPLATFVLRAVPGVARGGMGAAVAVLLAADLAIVLLALRARRHPLSPLSWVLGATVALIMLDVATGARLQTSSVLGYSLHTAARFTGLGNTAFAVLAASAVVLGVIHLEYAPRRQEALWAVGLLFLLVVVVDGAPSLGDDVGGILTLVPVLGVTLFVLSGRRLRLRTVVVLAAVAVAVVALAAGVELLRPATERTHLGQLVTTVQHGGSGSFFTTVARKLSTNLRTYRSVWLWAIVVVAAYFLFFMAWGRGWTRLVAPGSALRVGVIATLAVGIVGNFLNDSGAVVTALVFVYLGPFLTLLALARERAAAVGVGADGVEVPAP